jgi:MFS family permease/rhodanese-related sulfurtransferase
VAELTRRFHLPSALRSSPSRISREAARDLVARGALVIDVRRHDDESDRLPDALRISPDMIPSRVAGFRRDVPIVLACTCTREATSVRVAHWLRDRGFDAYAVRGGAAELGDRAEGRSVALSEPVDRGPGAGPLAALRYRQFRRYSAGVLISLTGNWVEAAAFGYVVLLLGGSAATLALIGFLNTIPNLIWGLPAGALADRFDQRKLLLGFQGANMGVAVLLAVLWQTGSLTVPLLGAIALVGGSLGTLSFPAFQGLLASTVPRRALEGAVAINSLLLQLARFLGPAIAGFLLAVGGPTWVFVVNAVSFLGVFTAVALLAGSPAAAGEAAARLGGAMKEGLRYVFGQRSLSSLIVLTLVGGVFGTPPVAFMLPGIVRFQLDAGPATLGALTSALGLGSLLASVALLSLARRPNKGEPVLAGYLLSALAIAAVGVSSSIPVSLALALVGGFCGVLFVGLSTVVVQAMASDEMRARAMAIWAAAFVGLLPLGALITAGLAAWLGVGSAVLVDGLVMFVGGLVVIARRPELAWLGCAALPEACLASTNPAAVAIEGDLHAPDPAH